MRETGPNYGQWLKHSETDAANCNPELTERRQQEDYTRNYWVAAGGGAGRRTYNERYPGSNTWDSYNQGEWQRDELKDTNTDGTSDEDDSWFLTTPRKGSLDSAYFHVYLIHVVFVYLFLCMFLFPRFLDVPLMFSTFKFIWSCPLSW
jgi:hypothetical protein